MQLDAPTGGITYYTSRDTIVVIRWSGIDDTVAVRLDYTINDGRSWSTIADSAKGLSYDWNIARLSPGTTYRVRVSQLRPPGAADQIVYRGHAGDVADAWWNPANTRVVSVASEAHVWDATTSTNTPLLNLPTGRATYYSVRWSDDSTKIITGSNALAAKVVDVATNTIASTLDHTGEVQKVELDPTGSWLFTKSDNNEVRVYNLPNTAVRARFPHTQEVSDISINPDGSRVVVCTNRALLYGRSFTPPSPFTQHSSGVTAAAFSPDGTRVCSIGGDRSVRMWSATNPLEAWSYIDTKEGMRSVAYSPDGKLVAVGMADSRVMVFTADDGKIVHTFDDYNDQIRMVSFSPDGTMLAGASNDDFARVHDLVKGQTIASFQHRGVVNVVRWSKQSDRLLTTSADGTARIWQVMPIVLQADTSEKFAIAPPPPAFVRFIATGDTLEIEETTTIRVRTEGAQFLGLAQIDSVRLRISYDPSMLNRLTASIPFTSENAQVYTDSNSIIRSIQYLECTLPLDTVDRELFTVTFQATLGQDSVSRVTFEKIDQIAKGPGARIDKRSDPILVRGICRIGDGARLYNSIGGPLLVTARSSIAGVHVDVSLAETAPATVSAYDLRGALLWRDRSTSSEEAQRRIERVIPASLVNGAAIIVVSSPTQSASTIVVEGGK